MAEFWKGEEQQARTVGTCDSTMDVSGLLLRELRLERLLPQLQSSGRLGVSWWQRWQFCGETGSAGHILGVSLGGVRQVAVKQRVSLFGCDVDRGGCFSQNRGAGSLQGFGCEHREPRESSRWQANEVLQQKRLERQELKKPDAFSERQLPRGKRWSSSSRVCRRRRSILKQQEIADAKNEAADKARKVEMLQPKRPAEVDCDGSVSHVSSASCSSPLFSQWVVGLAASLPEDARMVYQRRFRGQDIRRPSFGGSEPGVSRDSTASGSCLVDAARDDISGIQLQCCQGSFPLAAGFAVCCEFQTSKSQERPPGAEQISNAVARPLPQKKALRTNVFSSAARATADPAEQAFEVCTMADFSR